MGREPGTVFRVIAMNLIRLSGLIYSVAYIGAVTLFQPLAVH